MDLPQDAGVVLLPLARAAIAERVGASDAPATPQPLPDWARRPGASFVTLTVQGRLRGCIGSLVAHRPLARDVWENAQAAAVEDPRFEPVDAAQYERLSLEVSVLTAPRAVPASTQAEALSRLRPGIDGVILQAGYHRATFLPQVWQELPDPRDFLGELKLKAGLARTWWDATARLSVYRVRAWSESHAAGREPEPVRALAPRSRPGRR